MPMNWHCTQVLYTGALILTRTHFDLEFSSLNMWARARARNVLLARVRERAKNELALTYQFQNYSLLYYRYLMNYLSPNPL